MKYLKYHAALAHPSLRLCAALGLAGHNEPLALPNIARAFWWIDFSSQGLDGQNKAIKDGGIAPWKDLNKEKR